MKKIIALVLALAMCLSLCACGKKEPSEEWPTSGLGSMLPVPDAKNIHIGYNLDDSFSADIRDAKAEDFTSYIAKCEAAGFTVEVDRDSDEYTAYNTDGYKVSISFYDSLESVSIMLATPKVNSTFTWPTMGLATLLPTPDTNVGTISIDTHIQFNAWIGETSFEDYKAYVNQCAEMGFNVDYSNYEKVYDADNADGVSLRLEYQGFNTMYISMYAPDDKESVEAPAAVETEPPIEETTPAETQAVASTGLVDGMRPEFKEALDSYEAFFVEYCEFMKKYSENPTDIGLLADYGEYMTQYADTMSKLDALDDGEMNDAELLYYVEVSNRISQMLLEVSISMG